ncbi:MAG: hypothetical protein WCK67_03035 [bacterium]
MGLNVNNHLIAPQQYAHKRAPQDKNHQRELAFGDLGSVATNVIKTIDTNDLLNYSLLDFASMIGPRSYIDAKRNPYAGVETFLRESFGAVSMCIIPGFVAMGLAGLAGKFNNPTGVKTTLHARPAVVDYLHKDVWTNLDKNNDINGKVNEYVKKCFDGLHVSVGTKADGGSKVVKFLDHAVDASGKNFNGHENKEFGQILTSLQELILHPHVDKEKAEKIAVQLADAVGERSGFSIKLGEKESIATSADHFVRDIVDIGRHILTKYDEKGMSASVKEKLQNNKVDIDKALGKAVETFKGASKFKTVATFAIIGSLCFSFQFINRAITKARTGKSGFVGYSDFGNDDKNSKNKTVKTDNKTAVNTQNSQKPKLAFKGWIDPTITGPYADVGFFRGIYPLTITGRLFAARDPNEFRETLTRDVLGYLNWLVLGSVAAKLMGGYLSKGMLVKGETSEGGNILDKVGKFFKSGLMSHNDISAYVENVKRTGKLTEKAKTMLRPETFDKVAGDSAALSKELLKKLNFNKNISWITGFVWSTAMLGIVLPKYNAYVTEKKRKAQLAAQQNGNVDKLQVSSKNIQVKNEQKTENKPQIIATQNTPQAKAPQMEQTLKDLLNRKKAYAG